MSRNEQDKKDQIAAQIALGSGHTRAAEPCLENETLAALVDHRLVGAQLQQAQQHIANCSHCYSHWRQVSLAVAPLAVPLQQPQTEAGSFWQKLTSSWMSWSGGGLAVAAAAILAVNIIPMADPQVSIDDVYQQYGQEITANQRSSAKNFESSIFPSINSWQHEQIEQGKALGRKKLGLSPSMLPENNQHSCNLGSDCAQAEKDLQALGQWLLISRLQCQSEYSASEGFWLQQKGSAQALAKNLSKISPKLSAELTPAKANEASICAISRLMP